MSNQSNIKQKLAAYVAQELIKLLPSEQPCVIGMGTGSTINCLIQSIANIPNYQRYFKGMLVTSHATKKCLEDINMPIYTTKDVQTLDVYIDGADEIDANGFMIKGGGGALTQEKIIASMAKRFLCIADNSKQVEYLGKFPLPIEVIPMSYNLVSYKLLNTYPNIDVKLRMRADNSIYTTDNQAYILDVYGMQIKQPLMLEQELNQIAGIITNGIFAQQKAHILFTNSSNEESMITIRI
jgi:ribose 5-phosphate isomerase A